MYGLGFVETFAEPDYASMDPYEAVLAYGAAHPGDVGQPSTGGYVQPQIKQSAPGVMAYLQQNSTAVYIGAAALAALAILGRRR